MDNVINSFSLPSKEETLRTRIREFEGRIKMLEGTDFHKYKDILNENMELRKMLKGRCTDQEWEELNETKD